MIEQGNFSFQCNQYQFIERYSLAFRDEWGYQELVMHPAPLNFFTLILVPAALNKVTMKNFGEAFGKFVFWFENIFYIFGFLLYELFLIPILFFKIIYHIIMQTRFFNMVYLLLIWFPFGILFLFVGLIQDLFYFIKILCDPKNEDEIPEQQRLDDERDDKVVIYNEIIEVMKLMRQLYVAYEKDRRRILAPLEGYRKRPPGYDDPKKRGIIVSKALIIEAWSMCRP